MDQFNRIYLDCDGVLADFVGALLHNFNAKHGTSFTHDDVTDWTMSRVLAGRPWRDYTGPGFFKDMAPTPWASHLVLAARQTGKPFAYLTHLPNGTGLAIEDRRDWVDHWFDWAGPGAAHKRVIVTEQKELVVHPGDLLIDDNPEFVEAVRAVGGTAWLLAQPWNAHADALGRLTPEQIIERLHGMVR